MNIISDLLYAIKSRNIQEVTLDDYASVLTAVLGSLLPLNLILSQAGIRFEGEWSESKEQQSVSACNNHLLDQWQSSHNSLNDTKPSKQYKNLHKTAMLASRAYGETLSAYIQFQTLFWSPQYQSRSYYAKQKDGIQWDKLTVEYLGRCLAETKALLRRLPEYSHLLGVAKTTEEELDFRETLIFLIKS